MKLSEVKKIAALRGIQTEKMKKTEIIRTIQEAEGNRACFASGEATVCGQEDCLWRGDCM